MSLIAIDCGTTRLKIGLFKGDELIYTASMETSSVDNSTEFGETIEKFRLKANSSQKLYSAVSSVALHTTPSIIKQLSQLLNQNPYLVTADSYHGVAVSYEPPTSLGTDRLADCIAASALYNLPCITINFGTATTFNVIIEAPSGVPQFVGGAIAAGLDGVIEGFSAQLPALPKPEIRIPTHVIGRSTEEGVASGIIFGHASMADGMVNRIVEELGISNCTVVATGGYAQLLAPLCCQVNQIEPFLALRGVSIITRRLTGWH